MKVLHLTRDFPPRVNGGLSTAVGGLVAASRRAGLQCAVLSFDGWRPRRQAQAGASQPLPEDGGRLLRLSAPDQLETAAAFAHTFSADIIHVHHAMLWEFAEALARETLPVIKSVHLLHPLMNELRGIEQPTISGQAQERVFERAARLLVPSRAVADWLETHRPRCARRLRLAPLGVDDLGSASEGRAERLPGAILYAGRFADINGTAELLAAIPRVLAAWPQATFTVAGGQPENLRSERRWRRRFQQSIPEDVQHRVTLTGWLSPDELHRHYRRHQIQVVPSWFETFGQTTLEGMLHGLPVVASRAGGLPELIRHGGTGWLVPPRDVGALAAGLGRLLDDPDWATLLGEQAAREVRENWLWNQRVDAVVEVYEELF